MHSDCTGCPLHGGVKTGSFPENIKAAVQYGKNLQAMVVAFNTVGAVSINRTHEILSSVFNIPLATGIIKNMVTHCAEALKDTYERIRLKMITLGLVHCDETGTRVDGKTIRSRHGQSGLRSFCRYMIKHFFPVRMRSAAITAINLIWSMIPSSKLHMGKIHFLKLQLKSAVGRKKAKY